jgi:hypothetical protein
MNASTPLSHAPSGTYRIVPAAAEEFAKRDAWIVEMTLISKPYEESREVCKSRLDRAGGAELLGVWSRTRSAWISTCTAWICDLPGPASQSRARSNGSLAPSSAGAKVARSQHEFAVDDHHKQWRRLQCRGQLHRSPSPEVARGFTQPPDDNNGYHQVTVTAAGARRRADQCRFRL